MKKRNSWKGPAQKVLFAARCWSCGKPLGPAFHDFCFFCRRELLRAMEVDGCLLRYEGSAVGLISCLRGTAPRLGARWCLSLLERKGLLRVWAGEKFSAVAVAPQNPKSGESGLARVGGEVARRLGLKLLLPFEKIGQRSQHGRSLSDRMDACCFIRLKKNLPWEGEKILLLDDVLTTGTTLDQCAYVLRKAGAKEVVSFSLAKQMMPSFERKQSEPRHESEEMNPLLLHLFV